jgi:hypothetical protein
MAKPPGCLAAAVADATLFPYRGGLMNQKVVALIVLILFSGFTAYAMAHSQESLADFGFRLMSSLDTAQVVIDLYLLCSLACVWMYRDNRSKGKKIGTILPYFFLTVVFASIGPLLYIVVSTTKENRSDSNM